MSPSFRKQTRTPGSDAVSEVIGAVLMISVVVVAIALIAVILTSQTTPQTIPNVNFMTGTNADGTELFLYHNGGDALRRGEFAVVTDIDPAPRTDFSISDGSDEWSIGRNLILTVATPPKTVAVVYTAGADQGGMVLKSGSSSVAVLKETIRPDATPMPIGGTTGGSGGLDTTNPQNVVNYILGNTSLIADALNQSPSTVGPVFADVIGTNSTNYYREGRASIDQGTSIMLEITDAGSTFAYDSTTLKTLGFGDKIVITQARSNPRSWKIFGLGDQIWEFAAEGVHVDWWKESSGTWTNTTWPHSGNGVILYHTRITGYKDIGSTLTIRTNSGEGQYQALIHNYQKEFEGESTAANDVVVIRDIQPVGLGLFVFEYDDDSDSVYFVGYARSVSWS